MQVQAVSNNYNFKMNNTQFGACCCTPAVAVAATTSTAAAPAAATTAATPAFLAGTAATIGKGLAAIGITSPYAPFVVIGAGAAAITYGAVKGTRKLLNLFSRKKNKLQPTVR